MIFSVIARRFGVAWAIAVTIIIGVMASWPNPTIAETPTSDPQAAEATALAALLSPGSTGAVAAVQRVRPSSALASTLPAGDLTERLAKLLQWMVRDYARSGPVRLLSALPEGRDARGHSGVHLLALAKTYWLQDNALYGAAALDEYAPVLGKLLAGSWQIAWQRSFPRFCPDTQSDYVTGRLPPYDQGGAARDPRCQFPRPGTWQFFREYQYPDPARPEFDRMPGPIIGTDYPADPAMRSLMVPIRQNSPRDLLKYGCLRQVLLGNRTVAQQMFGLALGDWDGSGFVSPRNNPKGGGRLAGTYWTRDLVFALMCSNALGQGAQQVWGGQRQVGKAAIERELWSTQSPTGGMWTNYCGDSGVNPVTCPPGQKIPTFGKQTNELAPLVLLAYGANIWASSH